MTFLKFSPDGKQLAVVRENADEVLLYSQGLKNVRTLKKHRLAVWSVAFSSDGSLIATASMDDKVLLWRNDTAEVIGSLEGHKEGIFGQQNSGGLVRKSFGKALECPNPTRSREFVLQPNVGLCGILAGRRNAGRLQTVASRASVRILAQPFAAEKLRQRFRIRNFPMMTDCLLVDVEQTVGGGQGEQILRVTIAQTFLTRHSGGHHGIVRSELEP